MSAAAKPLLDDGPTRVLAGTPERTLFGARATRDELLRGPALGGALLGGPAGPTAGSSAAGGGIVASIRIGAWHVRHVMVTTRPLTFLS
jgi:hypothetical protein